MISAQTFTLYRLFKQLTPDDVMARSIVEQVEVVVENKFEQKKEVLATKDNAAAVKAGVAKLEGRLSTMIVENKAEMIKWMFIFWSGSIIVILGGLFGFLKLFLDK